MSNKKKKKKFKFNKATTITSVIAMLSIANQVLSMSGKSPLPISDDQVETIVSGSFTVVATFVAWFTNNFDHK